MKYVRRFFRVIGVLLILIIAAAFILPPFFKDDIKAIVDEQLAKSVNADVYFEADDFGLSFFTNFPNLTVSLDNFGVVGKDIFAGDTLLSVGSFGVELDPLSVIFGDEIDVIGISIDQLKMRVMVLEDGTANYDIAIPTEETTPETEEPAAESSGEYSVGIRRWAITNSHIAYYDQATNTLLDVVGLNHEGKGNFNQERFDLKTNTQVQDIYLSYEDVAYISQKSLDANLTLAIDQTQGYTFTFKDNTIKVNDFAFGFNGTVAMPSENIDFNLTYSAQDNTFKSLLSLIPKNYLAGYEDLSINGDLSFGGAITGTYTGTQIPAVDLNLAVKEGLIQYPSLPENIHDIALDLSLNLPTNPEQTKIDLKKLHMEFGNNPIDARLALSGLEDMVIDGNVKASLDLATLAKAIPMPGLELKGNYNLNATAAGRYIAQTGQMPQVKANMTFANGFIHYADYPIPIEDIHFTADVNSEGSLEKTSIIVEELGLVIDNEPMVSHISINNLADPLWNADLKGTLDLAKIDQIYPLEGMTLQGKITTDLNTQGSLAALEKEAYDQLPTKGELTVANFQYTDQLYLPQGFRIDNAELQFNPRQANLKSMTGSLGQSDIAASGTLTNYLQYALQYMEYMQGNNSVLRGELDFSSKRFNLNEWLVYEEDTTTQEEPEQEEEYEVTPVPGNIDFVLHANIAEARYEDLTLKNIQGDIIVRNGTVKLDKASTQTLGGTVGLTGLYDTRNLEEVKFNVGLNIEDLVLKETVKAFAPGDKAAKLAEQLNGKFSTDFSLKGLLDDESMPDISTLTGGGLLSIVEATMKGGVDSEIVNNLSGYLNKKGSKDLNLKDVIMKARVEDGQLFVQPFDVAIGQQKARISGSNGLDGSLNYQLQTDLPVAMLNEILPGGMSSLLGANSSNSQNVKVTFNIGGTFLKPQITPAAASVASSAKEQVTQAVKEEVKAKTDSAKVKAQQQVQNAKDSLKATTNLAADSAKTAAEQIKKDAEDKAKQELEKAKNKAKNKVKNIFKRGGGGRRPQPHKQP